MRPKAGLLPWLTIRISITRIQTWCVIASILLDALASFVCSATHVFWGRESNGGHEEIGWLHHQKSVRLSRVLWARIPNTMLSIDWTLLILLFLDTPQDMVYQRTFNQTPMLRPTSRSSLALLH